MITLTYFISKCRDILLQVYNENISLKNGNITLQRKKRHLNKSFRFLEQRNNFTNVLVAPFLFINKDPMCKMAEQASMIDFS